MDIRPLTRPLASDNTGGRNADKRLISIPLKCTSVCTAGFASGNENGVTSTPPSSSAIVARRTFTFSFESIVNSTVPFRRADRHRHA